MPNSLCLDRKLSILLRMACADYRQTSDSSCAKEARELERLSRFLGQDRGRGGPALEQFPRNQANAQRCGPGWRLRSVRYQGLRSEAFRHRKGFGRRSAERIDGYEWTSTKGSCKGFGRRECCVPDPERKA